MKLSQWMSAFTVAGASLLGATDMAQAVVVSVNINGFNGNPMAQVTNVTGVAGVVPVGNWNNAGAVAGTNSNDAGGATTGRDGTVTGLLDSNGAVTTASYTWAFNNYWGNNTSGSLTTQNNVLFRGYADTDGAGGNNSGITTMRVDGLPSSVTANGYAVIVYLGGDSNHAGAVRITGTDNAANSSTKFLVQNDNALRAGDLFLESVATTEAAALTAGSANFVRLTGFTGSTISLAFNDLSGGRARPVGFQIVGVEVPEPASLSLLAMGGLALLRRRRTV